MPGPGITGAQGLQLSWRWR